MGCASNRAPQSEDDAAPADLPCAKRLSSEPPELRELWLDSTSPNGGGEALEDEPVLQEEHQRLWRELGGEELEEPLREGWVKLVRASWLVRLAETGGVLRRRQELPQKAFVSLDELKAAGTCRDLVKTWLRIVVLSYPWLQPSHPDPHGESLRVIAKALRYYCSVEDESKPYGVLIDFTALPQADRTEEDNDIFNHALPALSLFFSHPHTLVFKVTHFPAGYPNKGTHRYVLPHGVHLAGYEERGWCFAELAMSRLAKSSNKVLDLGRFQGSRTRFNLDDATGCCKVGHVPPLHPIDFEVELDRKTFSSKKEDFGRVVELYSSAFQRRLQSALELDYHSLGWGPAEVRKVFRALQDSKSIQVLNFWGNEMRSEGAKVVGEALHTNATLLKLNLGDNSIGPEGAAALGGALRVNDCLQELLLEDNHVGSRGAVALAEALRVNASLQVLLLSENRIGPEGAAALGKALRVNTSLRELRLGSNNISRDSAAALGEALEENKSLQKLFLYSNGIDCEGMVALGQALCVNTSLLELDLGTNNLSHAGLAAITEALRSNTSLQKLSLVSNCLDSSDAVTLGNALHVNISLRELNVSSNAIERSGAVALAAALRRNKTLRTLDLRKNRIGVRGATALQEAAQLSGAQVHLDAIEGGGSSSKNLGDKMSL